MNGQSKGIMESEHKEGRWRRSDAKISIRVTCSSGAYNPYILVSTCTSPLFLADTLANFPPAELNVYVSGEKAVHYGTCT